jgi:hypothetical protein
VTRVEAVVGVAGGFVVAGREQKLLVAVHYDLGKRSCVAHVLGEARKWHFSCYSRQHHILFAQIGTTAPQYAIDLTAGVHYAEDTSQPSRVWEAWQALREKGWPGQEILAWPKARLDIPNLPKSATNYCCLDPDQGQLELRVAAGTWQPFVPLADGRPVLKECLLVAAKCCGNVLAIQVRGPAPATKIALRLFRGPDGIPLAEYPVAYADNGFTLSNDGALLARQTAGWQVEVNTTAAPAPSRVITNAGGFSADTQFVLGDWWILVKSGKQNLHLLRWDSGRLALRHTRSDRHLSKGGTFVEDAVPQRFLRAEGVDSQQLFCTTGTSDVVSAALHYDRPRFVRGATAAVTAVLDRFGQLIILDEDDRLVCMFFIFRDHLSGWLPDGACFGPASASGRPPTAQDLEKFGSALSKASAWGKRTVCE